MPTHSLKPTRITAAGGKPKIIEEFIGRMNSRIQQSQDHQHPPHAQPVRF